MTGFSSLVILVKRKNQNLYRVCSDFRILNENLLKINHAFPLVRDCIEQLGRSKCDYMSTIDLRDAFHTLRLAKTSWKYCGITPYYGSPTYHYLRIGMGMSVSPQIWQQFVDLVFQDNIIKRKQNFHVIIYDTFIHFTKEEHMDDLMGLFKVLCKYELKILPHKCQFFKKKIVYLGLECQVKNSKICYTPLKNKCEDIRNLELPKTLKQTRAFCGMVNFLSSFLPEHAYSHWVENLYVHKTKDCDTTQVKRKHGRLPNKRSNRMKLKSQLQTHALHDLDKPIKIPKTKLFPGI